MDIKVSAHGDQPRLRLDGLSKRYGNFVAVRDVSLSVVAGEFLTLLGPSGSGKTTTLMMIAGFEEPTSGNIFIDEKSMTGVPPYRRDYGMVFQNYALFPHRTVAENVAFPLRMRKIPGNRVKKMVAEMLEMVHLPDFAHRNPNELSGGQQQRVALARALVFNPPLLLMDEPLGALDKKLREDVQLEIKRIQKELAITTIHVTHDQEEALVMSDRIAVINNGRIEQLTDAKTLYSRPASKFVANFIGDSNILSLDKLRSDVIEATLQQSNVASATGNSLIVRPEAVRFENSANQLDCVFDGTIEDLRYVGDSTIYTVRLANDLVITAKVQNWRGEKERGPGSPCRVGWKVEDTTVVDG